MSSLLGFVEGLWTHVGPGLLLALALPVSLFILGALAREGWVRRANR